jgi:copper(I)-binding protein
MKKLLVPAFATTFLLGCGGAAEAPATIVENAVMTVPAVRGGPGAAYFTLKTNVAPSRLVSVTSPSISSIELHQTREEGGRTSMVPLDEAGATFSPRKSARLRARRQARNADERAPGLVPGGKVRLTFNVDPARPVTVEADVRGPGQAHAAH